MHEVAVAGSSMMFISVTRFMETHFLKNLSEGELMQRCRDSYIKKYCISITKGAGIAQRYSAGLRAEKSGFEFRQGLGIFLLTTANRQVLRPTQSPIQRVTGALSLGVKWSGCEDDHSPPSSAEVRNAWSYISSPPIRLYGVVLS
jgi:hypothetical protein